MTAAQRLVAASMLIVAVLAGAWWGTRRPELPPARLDSMATERPAPNLITVHVGGAVTVPGLVSLPSDARVADAVAAAGGAALHADLSAINLAAPIRDGDQIIVPGAGEDGRLPAAPLLIPLNTATAEDLEGLPGVGPVTAARIIAHRDEHGPFRVVEDLLDVPGIGEAKLAALRDAVRVP